MRAATIYQTPGLFKEPMIGSVLVLTLMVALGAVLLAHL
jgi:hypothetical protein